jgi:hypothetical protein
MNSIYVILLYLFFGGWIVWLCVALEWHWPGAGAYPYALKHKLYKKIIKYNSTFQNPERESNAYLMLAFIHEIFQRYRIPFWLSEGTALGFRRSNGFILHDDDVDIGMWIRDKQSLFHAIQALKTLGFIVAESKRDGTFLSLLWKKIILDIDVTGPGKICVANFGMCDELLPHLQTFQSIFIFDKLFYLPQDSYFEYLYGPDWFIPISNKKPERKAPWWRFI